MCGIYASGRGKDPAQIQAYFNDEHAMTLGCATTTYPVSAMPLEPGAMYYPQLGDSSCNDTVAAAHAANLYFTDITFDPTARPGDQQTGGRPITRLRFRHLKSANWQHARPRPEGE